MKSAERSALWPDLAAFASGLLFAAYDGWDTPSLVWSLWLASLVVGYALIVTSILRMLLKFASNDPRPPGWENVPRGRGVTVLGLFGALFLLGFFTVHFGGFHWGHSIFLHVFFPIDGSPGLSGGGMPSAGDYWQVVRQGWWFIPLAFVAERAAFRAPPPPPASVTKRQRPNPLEAGMLAPYKNVVRLHLLIFFFAFAHFVGLGGALIYVVVYAVYFFPWGHLRRGKSQAPDLAP